MTALTSLVFKFKLRSPNYILHKVTVLHSAALRLAEMWPAQQWIPRGGASSTAPQHKEFQQDRTGDHNFQVLASSLLTNGPVTSVPGEISISTSDSINFSSLMTKADTIIESPRDTVWKQNFGRLSNSQSVPNFTSSNHFQYEANSHSPTNLSNLIPNSFPQPQSSESNKPDPRQFYENIIKDLMSGSSFGDSQNPEARRLHGKASMLAASALSSSTKAN